MKPSSGSLTQFSGFKENENDAGDCGGVPVFNFWNVSAFGKTQKQKFSSCWLLASPFIVVASKVLVPVMLIRVQRRWPRNLWKCSNEK